jgi:two-component system sensor histidine kinase TctE
VPEAYKKDIDLGFEGSERTAMIDADAGRLRELLNNLLDNAIRYSRRAGRVTVRVSADPTPRVAISDDGPTIPSTERERIFERFHRVDRNVAGGGSGLGLAIVREIAQRHDATIAVDDGPTGRGVRISVSFP